MGGIDSIDRPDAKKCRDYCDSKETPNFTYDERRQKCTCKHKSGPCSSRKTASYISGPAKGCSDGINCRKKLTHLFLKVVGYEDSTGLTKKIPAKTHVPSGVMGCALAA